MTAKKPQRQRSPKREDQAKKALHRGGKPGGPRGERDHARDGDGFVEATHQVIEDEVRRGEAPVAPGPDQKGEPGSSV